MIKDELRHLRTGERRCQEVGSAAADDTPLRPMSGTSSRVLWGKRTLLSQALSLGTGRIPQAQWHSIHLSAPLPYVIHLSISV